MRRRTLTLIATPSTWTPELVARRSDHRWFRGLLVLIAMIVLADALVGDHSMASGVEARKRYAAAGAALSELRGQNDRLRDEVRRLRDDPAAIEYVARRDLGLARPGEWVIVLK